MNAMSTCGSFALCACVCVCVVVCAFQWLCVLVYFSFDIHVTILVIYISFTSYRSPMLCKYCTNKLRKNRDLSTESA